MACGDKYKELLVTVSGYTPDNPWGSSWYSVPSVFSYEEWYSRAHQLALRAGEHWKRLVQIESKTESDTERKRVEPTYNAMVEKIGKLSTPLGSFFSVGDITFTGDIDDAINAARDATCVLEEIDDSIATLGKVAPPIPTGPTPGPERPADSDWAQSVGSVVIIGAVGYGVWYLFLRDDREAA